MLVDMVQNQTKSVSGLKYPIGIIGTGLYEPELVVDNAQLTNGNDNYDRWIRKKFGIHERRFLPKGLATSDMCIGAARQALEKANLSAEELDAIIVCSSTPDYIAPSTALKVKHALGAKKAVPWDLGQTACAGGLYGIYLASHLLQNDHISHVMVIGAEVLSREFDPNDKVCRVLFGDAGGAVILKKLEGECNILAWDLRSDLDYAVGKLAGGTKKPITHEVLNANEQYAHMDGKAVLDRALKVVPEVIKDVIREAGLTPNQIDHYVLHQANINIIKKVMDALEQPYEKTTVTIHRLANTGSASNLSALHEAINQNRIKENDRIVMAAIGAGFLWGAICMQYRTR